MEENKQVQHNTCTAVPVRKGTAVIRAAVYHPVSLATKEYQEHIHGVYIYIRAPEKGDQEGLKSKETGGKRYNNPSS